MCLSQFEMICGLLGFKIRGILSFSWRLRLSRHLSGIFRFQLLVERFARLECFLKPFATFNRSGAIVCRLVDHGNHEDFTGSLDMWEEHARHLENIAYVDRRSLPDLEDL